MAKITLKHKENRQIGTSMLDLKPIYPHIGDTGCETNKDISMIKGLHHNAYRCRNSEETRKFYEDFLGLPLVEAFPIGETKTGRETKALHTFYQMDDGSHLAFFEVPDMEFDFKEQHDYDLHIALQVSYDDMMQMFEKGKNFGIETRGVADHGFIESIYFRDPNGYVIELTAPVPGKPITADALSRQKARAALSKWTDSNS